MHDPIAFNRDALRQNFDIYRDESLQHESHGVASKLQSTKSWLEQFKSDYSDKIAQLRKQTQIRLDCQVMLVDDDNIYSE